MLRTNRLLSYAKQIIPKYVPKHSIHSQPLSCIFPKTNKTNQACLEFQKIRANLFHSSNLVRSSDPNSSNPRKAILYTCKKCNTRNYKQFSVHAYEKGIVIVTCTGCSARHLIADNLGWFKHVDAKNIEEILQKQGETVKHIKSKGFRLSTGGSDGGEHVVDEDLFDMSEEDLEALREYQKMAEERDRFKKEKESSKEV